MQRPRSDYECPRVSSHSHTVSLTILDIIIDCVSSHVDSSSSGAWEVWVNVTGSGLRLAIASKHHQSHLDSYYCSLCITKRSCSLCEPMTDEVIWRLSSCSQYLNKQHKCEHPNGTPWSHLPQQATIGFQLCWEESQICLTHTNLPVSNSHVTVSQLHITW
jgi:hypothetical protein